MPVVAVFFWKKDLPTCFIHCMLVAVVRTWFDQGARACKKSCWPERSVFSCLEMGDPLRNFWKCDTCSIQVGFGGGQNPDYHYICHLAPSCPQCCRSRKGGNKMTEWNIVTWSKSPQKIVSWQYLIWESSPSGQWFQDFVGLWNL